MKTTFACAAMLSLALAAPVSANTSVSIGVQIGNAPPPPVVVYREEPHWVAVPHQRVCVVDDDGLGYDYFRYAGSFYIFNHGCWYRGRGYRGPFLAIEASSVPRVFYSIGDRDYHWHHRPAGLPPGIEKKRDHGGEVPPGWQHGKAKWKEHGEHGHD